MASDVARQSAEPIIQSSARNQAAREERNRARDGTPPAEFSCPVALPPPHLRGSVPAAALTLSDAVAEMRARIAALEADLRAAIDQRARLLGLLARKPLVADETTPIEDIRRASLVINAADGRVLKDRKGGYMTPERIAELRELCEMATPGPWSFECLDAGDDEDDASGGCWQVPEPLVTPSSDGDYLNGRNAWFIAAARTALPEALDEIERLRAEVAAMRPLVAVAVDYIKDDDLGGLGLLERAVTAYDVQLAAKGGGS
jgi:hypothetical protein